VIRTLLRLEGLAILAAALAVYLDADYNLVLAAVLLLAPDLSFAGYLAGPRVGAYAYNAVHTTIWPLALGAVGVVTGERLAIELALIWLAHIGMDRALGYGLKYPEGFKETHLQRV
jgi:hypothetical protein